MKQYNMLYVAGAIGIATLVPAIAALGDFAPVVDEQLSNDLNEPGEAAEVMVPPGPVLVETHSDGDARLSDEELRKWRQEQEEKMVELSGLEMKYGVSCIVERQKVEKVGGLYWRYAAGSDDCVSVLTVSPREYTSDDDFGGDVFGEIAIPEMLVGKTVIDIGDVLLAKKSVSSVVIPHGVTSLFESGLIFGDKFCGCKLLKKFVVADDHPAYSAKDGFLCDKTGKTLLCCPAGREGDIVIPDGIETIGETSFFGCNKITSLTVPPSVRKFDLAFGFSCDKLRAVHISDLSAWCRIEFASGGIVVDDSRFQQSNPICRAHNLYLNGRLVTDLEIPADVKSIGAMAFAGCTSLRSVVIHGGVTNIGEYAFGDCSVLESVEIREGVKSIRDGAFANCFALQEIVIPDSVASAGSPADAYAIDPCGAFKFCTSLRRAVLSKSLREIPKGLFMECRSLEEVEMPEDLEIIGNGAFFKCINLREMDFPGKVRIIGGNDDSILSKGAFQGCERLFGIEIPDSVERIWQVAFADCKFLEKVKIGSGVREIGAKAFANCTNLERVEMASEVAEVGADAFYNCIRLKFDNRPIPGFKMLSGIVVERTAPLGETLDLSGTKGIAEGAIGGWLFCPESREDNKIDPELEKLRHIIFPDGMKVLNLGTFANCGNVQEITVPPSIARIKDGDSLFARALSNWKHFKKVDISDLAAWSRIDFDVELAVPCSECCPGHRGVVIGSSNPLGIGAELLLDGKPVTELVIPGTVERIGEGAFLGYGQLKSVVIEEGVKEIGPFAFYGCTNLVSRKIANSVTNIGDRAFGKRMKREHNFPY